MSKPLRSAQVHPFSWDATGGARANLCELESSFKVDDPKWLASGGLGKYVEHKATFQLETCCTAPSLNPNDPPNNPADRIFFSGCWKAALQLGHAVHLVQGAALSPMKLEKGAKQACPGESSANARRGMRACV